jgi:hypothetical protein
MIDQPEYLKQLSKCSAKQLRKKGEIVIADNYIFKQIFENHHMALNLPIIFVQSLAGNSFKNYRYFRMLN